MAVKETYFTTQHTTLFSSKNSFVMNVLYKVFTCEKDVCFKLTFLTHSSSGPLDLDKRMKKQNAFNLLGCFQTFHTSIYSSTRDD